MTARCQESGARLQWGSNEKTLLLASFFILAGTVHGQVEISERPLDGADA